MDKYAKIDAAIIREIRAGVSRLPGLLSSLHELALPLANIDYAGRPEVDRVIDKRLQSLRRAGLIEFDRVVRAWRIPTGRRHD